jgi:predicted DNA-binding protein
MNKSKITSIRLPEAMRQRLERIAKTEQRTVSAIIKMAINDAIMRRIDAAYKERNERNVL